MDTPTLCAKLRAFITQRPGFEPALYASTADYRRELRASIRDRDDALAMLRWLEASPDDDKAYGLREALTCGGRLHLDGDSLDYTTGQYFPTEYRANACRVLANAWWATVRSANGSASCEEMHRMARSMFGAGVARRWF